MPHTPILSSTGRPIPRESRPIFLAEIVDMAGAERACIALSRWLFDRGIPNHFVTYRNNPATPSLAHHPIDIVELRPPMHVVGKVRALNRYFETLRPIFVPLMSGYQAAFHATLAQFPTFHTILHDTPSLFSDRGRPRQWHRRVVRSLSNSILSDGMRRGGSTFVTSQFLHDDTERLFDVSPTIVRMGGLGRSNSVMPRPAGPQLNLLSVCRLESSKRLDWILRALATLEHEPTPLSHTADWQLHLVGTGSLRESLQTLAADLRIATRVHLHGFVPDAELDALYTSADLFLMPALQGYGIPAIESLQRGTPVLLHRESGVSDLLLQTPWATVFSGGEAEMLPALRQAIDSVRHRRRLTEPPPALPTEDSWAEQIAMLCGWL